VLTKDKSILRARFQEFHDAPADIDLLNPAEEVEETRGMDYSDSSPSLMKPLIIRVEHVADDEGCTETVMVTKEVASDGDKPLLHVYTK
jgi:hypothetical protein